MNIRLFKTIFKIFFLVLLVFVLGNIDHSSLQSNNGYKIFLSKEWIFNWNVSQYSSIMRVSFINNNQTTKLLTFESTIFSDLPEDEFNFKELEKNLSCMILTNRYDIVNASITKLLSINLMSITEAFWKKSKFYRIECELKTNIDADISLFRLAVVNTRYLSNSIKVLHMQTPLFVNTSSPKAKSVASCVHMLRNISEQRVNYTMDWIRIQKSIGIAKIKIYSLEKNELLLKQIENNYKDLVEVIDYNTKLDDICHLELKNKIRNANSNLYSKLYENCQSAFAKHFLMSDTMVSNSHERLQSNDCFLKFKHNYEFVVNYDIDEFILPRQIGLNSRNCPNSFQTLKYNLYDFVKKLSESYRQKQV